MCNDMMTWAGNEQSIFQETTFICQLSISSLSHLHSSICFMGDIFNLVLNLINVMFCTTLLVLYWFYFILFYFAFCYSITDVFRVFLVWLFLSLKKMPFILPLPRDVYEISVILPILHMKNEGLVRLNNLLIVIQLVKSIKGTVYAWLL